MSCSLPFTARNWTCPRFWRSEDRGDLYRLPNRRQMVRRLRCRPSDATTVGSSSLARQLFVCSGWCCDRPCDDRRASDPGLGKPIQDIILGSVVVFEIIGPLFIRQSLIARAKSRWLKPFTTPAARRSSRFELVDRFRCALRNWTTGARQQRYGQRSASQDQRHQSIGELRRRLATSNTATTIPTRSSTIACKSSALSAIHC